MKLCRILIWVFAALWGIALLLLAIGTFGWFGQERDPLAGVFLIPLGLPWNLFALNWSEPGNAGLLVGVLAPGVNLVVLVLICRVFGRNAKTGNGK